MQYPTQSLFSGSISLSPLLLSSHLFYSVLEHLKYLLCGVRGCFSTSSFASFFLQSTLFPYFFCNFLILLIREGHLVLRSVVRRDIFTAYTWESSNQFSISIKTQGFAPWNHQKNFKQETHIRMTLFVTGMNTPTPTPTHTLLSKKT